MAKLSARGAYERFTVPAYQKITVLGGGVESTYRFLFALRSDGAILQRITWVDTPGSGNNRYGRDRDKHPDRSYHTSGYSLWNRRVARDRVSCVTREQFKAYLAALGYYFDVE
ncbi:MAG: hypothetical protein ACRDRL_24960 [Sciscionella sp.]